MRALGLAAALALLAAPANAAPVVYGMTFFDEAGAQIGTGGFAYDPGVTREIWTRADIDGALCDPLADPLNCFHQATWTPADVAGSLLGLSFDLGPFVFLEGSYFPPDRCQCGHVDPALWGAIFDDTRGEAFFIGAGDFALPHAFLVSSLSLLPFREDGILDGTVTFARIVETPLPAAWLLFLAATGALFGIRRHGVTPLRREI